MPTSSANPSKLRQYANDGMELSDALVRAASDVDEALDALASSGGGSPYVPALGTAGADFTDLAGDWRHLDEFTSDVADGFYHFVAIAPWSQGGVPLDDVVLSIDNSMLAREGRVGYADRDQAIADAQAMAAELDRLQQQGDATDVEDMLAFAEMAERGQYDPAFAVTFSEAVGVEGYNQAAAMTRRAYELVEGGDGRISPEGLAAVGVLARTMTTALDTLPSNDADEPFEFGVDEDGRHDPDNNELPDDQRLGQDFVEQLVAGYQPDYGTFNDPRYEPNAYPWENALDLSALVGMTDPPTEVAVAIANNRLTPSLASGHQEEAAPLASVSYPWGRDHGGLVTNYAEMLSRNDDASALWLDRDAGANVEGEDVAGRNSDLVLQRWGHDDIDGGAALAEVVENGLTHSDSELRSRLMVGAIDTIGSAQNEIRNPHLYDALASGVEANMATIDAQISDRWEDNPAFSDATDDPDVGWKNTHDFLRELMGDEAAADRVNVAATSYAQEVVFELDDSENRIEVLEETGRVLGVVGQAEANATLGAAEDEVATREARGRAVDYALGWAPGFGELNDLAAFADHSAGSLAFSTDGRMEDAHEVARQILIETDQNIAGMIAAAEYDSGQWTADEVIDASRQAAERAAGRDPDPNANYLEDVDFFDGQPGDANRTIKPVSEMSEDELRSFHNWAYSDDVHGFTDPATGEDNQARSDHNDMTSGVNGATIRLLNQT